MSEIQKAIEYFETQKRLFPHSFNVKSGYFDLAISALQVQAEMGKRNKPLALEQLRKMDGKPVWVEGETSLGVPGNCWALLMAKGTNKPAALNLKGAYNFSDYGKTWLAYDKKPVSE